VKVIVVGIGNPILKDDSVGIKVVEELSKEVDVDTALLTTTNFEVLDKIIGYDKAIIVDAIKTGNDPGTIYELSIDDIFVTFSFTNTHNLTLATTLKLGYVIFPDKMPKEIKLFAVEAEDVENFGKECTPKVKEAIPKVVELIKKELNLLESTLE
jgi:hydrogenase maturation protease